jgi:hypothetical protein
MTTLRASFMCSKAYREQFPDPGVQLTISVGQSVHEGERLIATVQLVNKSFSHCTIMVDDSIQWYTLAIGAPSTPSSVLLQEAIVAGDSYLARNEAIFARYLLIPYRIVRWKDWHGTLEWQQAIQAMEHTYHTNLLLKQAIDQNVETFLTRYEKTKADNHYNRTYAIAMCTNYLIEECAVMREFWIKLGCHYEVYPSKRNEAMTATHKLFIEPYHSLLLPISLRFNRQKSKAIEPSALGGIL